MGIPGCGFFGLQGVGEVVVATPQVLNSVIITVLEGEVSLDKLAEELTECGLEGWDWQLEQLLDSEFGGVFPPVRACA